MTQIPSFKARLAVLLTGLWLFAGTASAGPVIYTYTGNFFNHYVEPYTAQSYVSVVFVLDEAMGANLSNFTYFAPTSFTVTDGVTTYTEQSQVGHKNFIFTTDDLGRIVKWTVDVGLNSDFFIATSTMGAWPTDFAINGPSGDLSAGAGYINNQPGKWEMTTADPAELPEPSTMAVVGLGLFLMAGVTGSGRGRRRPRETLQAALLPA